MCALCLLMTFCIHFSIVLFQKISHPMKVCLDFDPMSPCARSTKLLTVIGFLSMQDKAICKRFRNVSYEYEPPKKILICCSFFFFFFFFGGGGVTFFPYIQCDIFS